MTRVRLSARVRANRANAQRSTGPKSAAGKARVALNGVVHGLAVASALAPSSTSKIEVWAKQILHAAGAFEGVALQNAARELVEAQLRLLEVRELRRHFWARLVSGAPEPDLESQLLMHDAAASEYRPLRRVAARRAVRNAKRAEPLKNIDALEKYERRALARRKRAAREFTALLAMR